MIDKLLQRPWFWPLLIITAIGLVYGQALWFEFVSFDDPVYVVRNGHVNTGLSLDNIIWAFSEYHTGNWHPLTWISHMIDVEVYGLDPGFHHLTNIVLHCLNSLLLLLLFHRLGIGHVLAVSMVLLFALHPSHVESIVWISERKDVLSTLFLLLSLLAYLRYRASPSLVNYCLVFVLLGCGLMSKSMLMTLPFVMVLLDYYPLNRIWPKGENFDITKITRRLGQSLVEKLPLFILVFMVLYFVYQAQDAGLAVVSLDVISVEHRILNALIAYSHYIYNAVLPANLAMLYPHPAYWPMSEALKAAAFLALITAFALINIRRRPYIFVGWFWFLGTLVPVIGFIQLGNQYMADRYTYVPYIGLFFALVPLIYELLHKLLSRVNRGDGYFFVSGSAVLLFYSLVTFQYAGHWRNSIELYSHTLFTIDPNYSVYLGMEPVPPGGVGKPRFGSYAAYYNMGNALAAEGQFGLALMHYEKATEDAPRLPNARNNGGLMLAALGRKEEAIEMFRQLSLDIPSSQQARDNLLRIQKGWEPGSEAWLTLGKKLSEQ